MTSELLLSDAGGTALPLWLLNEASFQGWLAQQPEPVANWVRANAFQAERQRVLVLPGEAGQAGGALLGLGSLREPDDLTLWYAAGLSDRLPAARYQLATALRAPAATQFALGWLIGAYRITRYRSAGQAPRAVLVAPTGADLEYVRAAAAATTLARDLINTPANDLGPAELAQAAAELAARCGAHCQVLSGAELDQGYPLIRAVGAGSARAPCLVDLRWGATDAPRVTLVGKGVCFDSGGLDLKPGAAMLLMKKDMGGAACALGLASLLMSRNAPIRLRVLLPCAENSVDGLSYRPGDILRSRKGLTIEIGNTDAEGRLVLADALAEADTEAPDLLIDMATLTGAARTALGPELPAAYSPAIRCGPCPCGVATTMSSAAASPTLATCPQGPMPVRSSRRCS